MRGRIVAFWIWTEVQVMQRLMPDFDLSLHVATCRFYSLSSVTSLVHFTGDLANLGMDLAHPRGIVPAQQDPHPPPLRSTLEQPDPLRTPPGK